MCPSSVPHGVPVRRAALHPARLALRRARGLRRPLGRAQLPRVQARRRGALRQPALHQPGAPLRRQGGLPLGAGREELP